MTHFMREDVMEAVDSTWRTAREIAEIVNCWAPISIRKNLNDLTKAGKIEMKTEPFQGNFRCFYRAKP